MSPREVTFFVQANSSNGMGHLMRSASLAIQLAELGVAVRFYVEADESGWEKVSKLNLAMASLDSCNYGYAVVDAVSLSPSALGILSRFRNRVLISPVCDHPQFATHVLVRSLSDFIKQRLSEQAEVIVSNDFAFVTSCEEVRRNLEYERLSVGVCVTGGSAGHCISQIVNALLGMKEVENVKVIDEEFSKKAVISDQRFECVRYVESPWEFFSNVNVFLGGEGVMISEAIAQCIPTVSICSASNLFKNNAFAEAGCLKVFERETFEVAELAAFVMQRSVLARMHLAAHEMIKGIDRYALAKAVYRVLVS